MAYPNILSTIKTVEDRNRLYSEIEVVSAAIYKEGELMKVLSSQVSRTLAEHIGNETSTEALSRKISDLKKSLDGLVVVKLTLAFEPSTSTIDKILAFLRQNFGEQTILELRFESKILGGVIFEFKGLYKDYTLKSRLEEVFRTKREEILNPKH
ncbi:MAG: hypothetical protein A2868_00020 [Candidatus Levybacteria bacterium RIFCSPHIGHO2_01_FULL_40_15b]|nr:MAG: hypothetical protein A2868_00020 [Candidatus Levybacteria bacterium RIFCSPHIGHO2_01_FULL_40_15b]